MKALSNDSQSETFTKQWEMSREMHIKEMMELKHEHASIVDKLEQEICKFKYLFIRIHYTLKVHYIFTY